MQCLKLLILVISIVAILPLTHAQEPAKSSAWADSKDPFIRQAKIKYNQSMQKAQLEYEEKISEARKILLADLKTAEVAATKEGDLDKGLSIRSLKLVVEKFPTKLDGDRVTSFKLEILSAFYGANLNWYDVTEKARTKALGKTELHLPVKTADWGDPCPTYQNQRTLIVRYRLNGRTKSTWTYEGHTIHLD